ncbi:MAG: polysaccharide pyruvyl transferase family protein [Bifidobacteriaceae bacterium]|jgi:polysaccharide pyruvyl transferase WcaK-like protein|nr:polysaccharide pyruvyl transferase family protein [Bifidobacteriaceae bacterium]
MRTLVLWAHRDSANLGVRVLAEGMSVFAEHTWGRDTQVDFQDFGAGVLDSGIGARRVALDLVPSATEIAHLLARYDLILDSGAGDSFGDTYGLRRMLVIAYIQRKAMKLGLPLVLGPQTIGPFRSSLARRVARATLIRATAVLARDPVSGRCAERLGATPIASADVVFGLRPVAPTRRRDVMINVSGLLWNGTAHIAFAQYRRALVELATRLIERGRKITLFAHVLDNPSADNDVPAVHDLHDRLAAETEVLIPTSLSQVRSAIAGANVVIGARMHACLNALSLGVPAIAWAYSRKFTPLLSSLGWRASIDLRAGTPVVNRSLKLVDAADSLRAELPALRRRAGANLAASHESVARLIQA